LGYTTVSTCSGRARAGQPRNQTHTYLAATLALTGDKEAAKWEAEEIRVLAPDFSIGNWLQSYPMTNESQKRRLTSLLAEPGL
jgi:hypothetical protein